MARAIASSARSNSILAALPERDFDRLRPHLDSVELPLGTAIYEAGSRVRQLYFPTSGIVSLLQVMADGASAEIAVVGSEGVVGIAMFMGGETTPSRAVVQSAAHAHALSADVLKMEFARGGMLQYLLLRYTQELIANMLGVRREGVTAAASELQRAGCIHYVRGRIEVIDRAKLEQRACECYGVVKQEYARLELLRQQK